MLGLFFTHTFQLLLTKIVRVVSVLSRMKVAIIGSRSFNNQDLMFNTLDRLRRDQEELQNLEAIISGGAKGADSLAKQYASSNKIPLKEFLPEYKKYGKNAPLKRNLDIILYSDVVLAFWNGKSRGTLHAINTAKNSGKKTIVITYPEPHNS